MVSYLWSGKRNGSREVVLILVVVDNGLVHTRGYLGGMDANVLILVVVDNGLVHRFDTQILSIEPVLILVVVDNGLVRVKDDAGDRQSYSLNPCCSGQWSRTYWSLVNYGRCT